MPEISLKFTEIWPIPEEEVITTQYDADKFVYQMITDDSDERKCFNSYDSHYIVKHLSDNGHIVPIEEEFWGVSDFV